MEILEVIGNQVRVDMRHPVVLSRTRRLNYKFMAAEAWWILSGKRDTQSIGKFCKNILQFSDDGETFFGAYGPKIRNQLGSVIRCLEMDRDSRQAVINIWRENPPVSKDIPCTLSAQFLIRDNKLHCIDTMRSNDVWLGFPYDVFNFSMLSWKVLDELRFRNPSYQSLELGSLYLNAGSHHLYERNRVMAERITAEENDLEYDPLPEAGYFVESVIEAQLGWAIGTDGLPLSLLVTPFFNSLRNLQKVES
jgi:thymidylate synthase